MEAYIISIVITVIGFTFEGFHESNENTMFTGAYGSSEKDALHRAVNKFKRQHDALAKPAHEYGILVADYPVFGQTLPELLDLVVANSGHSVELSSYDSDHGYSVERGIDVNITLIPRPDNA